MELAASSPRRRLKGVVGCNRKGKRQSKKKPENQRKKTKENKRGRRKGRGGTPEAPTPTILSSTYASSTSHSRRRRSSPPQSSPAVNRGCTRKHPNAITHEYFSSLSDACKSNVPVALIDMHSCSLDSKIRMNLEAQVVEKVTEVKKQEQRKRSRSSENKDNNAKKEKKSKNSNMPKRPPTAFFIFMDEFRKSYKEANPDSKGVAEVGKAGGEKWKSMTEEEKKPYLEKAAELKAEYEKAKQNDEEAANDNENENDENEAEDKGEVEKEESEQKEKAEQGDDEQKEKAEQDDEQGNIKELEDF